MSKGPHGRGDVKDEIFKPYAKKVMTSNKAYRVEAKDGGPMKCAQIKGWGKARKR